MSATKWYGPPRKTVTDGGDVLWGLTSGITTCFFPRESTANRVFSGEIDYEAGWVEDRKWLAGLRT